MQLCTISSLSPPGARETTGVGARRSKSAKGSGVKRTSGNRGWDGGRVACLWLAAACLLGAEGPLASGKRALAAGRYEEAARFLEQARHGPAGCEGSFYLGLTRYRLKQLDAAIVE